MKGFLNGRIFPLKAENGNLYYRGMFGKYNVMFNSEMKRGSPYERSFANETYTIFRPVFLMNDRNSNDLLNGKSSLDPNYQYFIYLETQPYGSLIPQVGYYPLVHPEYGGSEAPWYWNNNEKSILNFPKWP